jgi:hypothetical protein
VRKFFVQYQRLNFWRKDCLLSFSMQISSRMVIFFIFLLAIAINCQQAAQISPVDGLSQTSVVNAKGFFNRADDSQLIAAGDDADEVPNLPLVESGMSVDDLFAFFPPTISNAVFHIAHPKPPEIIRL